ncbi:DUF1289 domain-containing protein [Variovorax sp. VNK109]|jgi:predicted Fe-S protein YdhL (DUF1289 family)|uniref:DUF1289 domain-containing protein n=1 Tax=Variovorax sp. VNK109 TaxID=3400919 RepID=UPI003BFC0FBF
MSGNASTPAVPPAVRSPCVSVCVMSERSGLCEGCWRTLDEIAAWSAMDDARKREVWTLLRERRRMAGAQP